MLDPAEVVTANLVAYNARDLEAFAASFDPAVEIVGEFPFATDLGEQGMWVMMRPTS